MTRKLFCLLALAALLTLPAVALADGGADDAAYAQAAQALQQQGLRTGADTALTEGRGMAAAGELGLLAEGEPVPLAQLGAQALLEQQSRAQEAEDAARARQRRSSYLTVYDGAMAEKALTVRAAGRSDAAALRTLPAGKVAQLLDVTEEGWFRISFAGTEGYVPAHSCRGVAYDDYKNTPAARDLRAELLAFARTWLGTPYVYGGSSRSGTDCSGFTMQCFAAVGIPLGHGARSQYAAATPVTTAQRRAGDLVFFSAPGQSGIAHVGIYLGGGQFIHASSSRGVVIDSIGGDYFGRYYCGAGRLLHE